MSFQGKLTLSAQGTGTFTYQGTKKSLMIFKIFGKTKQEIRKKAKEILAEVTAVASNDRTDEYKADFKNLPNDAAIKISQEDDWDFDLPYDPYDGIAGVSWGLYCEATLPIVVVLQ